MGAIARWSTAELKEIVDLARLGQPFVAWRGADGEQRLLSLEAGETVVVGRRAANELALTGDGEASRTHAELRLVGQEWTVIDDGMSRNGTFINGNRLRGRQRLVDGDEIRFGQTVVEFHRPGEGVSVATSVSSIAPRIEALTPIQRRILVALCRPYRDGGPYASPATNPDIAREVFLGVDAVKAQVRQLCSRFGISDLPPNQKRSRLAELAMQWGIVLGQEL